MDKIKNLWSVLLVAFTSASSVSSTGTSATYLALFKKRVPRQSIRSLILTTVTKTTKLGNNRVSPLLAYCLVEGESGTLSSFRVKDPQTFRMTAKRYGMRVDSFVKSQESFTVRK